MSENIFQKIVDRELPAEIVYEDDEVLAFRDINPQAPTHILVIPKNKVIRTHDEVTEEDCLLLGQLHLAVKRVAEEQGLGSAYRIVLNCGEEAGQTVPHLHLHLLAGRPMKWPPG